MNIVDKFRPFTPVRTGGPHCITAIGTFEHSEKNIAKTVLINADVVMTLIDELFGEIEELEQAVTGYEHKQQSAEKFIALIDKYESFDTLTTTILNEFVEKIVVHERDRKGCQDTTQDVEIYFNFVGRYVPPHFEEVGLTPEEREALLKKEELRDRMHRNYLCRKADGKQKQFDDKIKAAKKRN